MTAPDQPRLDTPIKSVGVVLRAESSEVASVVERLSEICAARGVSVEVEARNEDGSGDPLASSPQWSRDKVDLVVSLGGDGTLLRAARSVIGTQIPVLGVNLGRLGFLTAVPASDLEAGLERVLDGEAVLDYRFVLRTTIPESAEISESTFFALNDVVVHTSGAARVTALAVHLGRAGNWEEVGSFTADGVIIATPTGSTAYSMSAGGPIIVPEVEGIVITPICPHSLAVRPLVVPAHQEIRVRPVDAQAEHQLTVDGQVVRVLDPGESVVVARERAPVPLVRLGDQTFLGTLRRKLNWAPKPPERT